MAEFIGTRRTISNKAYLVEGVKKTLLIMKDPQRNLQENIAAATAFLDIKQILDGDTFSAYGDKGPINGGPKDAISMDDAVKR